MLANVIDSKFCTFSLHFMRVYRAGITKSATFSESGPSLWLPFSYTFSQNATNSVILTYKLFYRYPRYFPWVSH